MKPNLQTILLIAVAVLLTLQIKSMFTRPAADANLIRAEERLKVVEEKRRADSVVYTVKLAMYDSLISASKERSRTISVEYQTKKAEYEKIPIAVNDYDRERLRIAFAEYR